MLWVVRKWGRRVSLLFKYNIDFGLPRKLRVIEFLSFSNDLSIIFGSDLEKESSALSF